MSAVSVFDGKGVCVREEAGGQRTVFAGESELRERVWKVRCVVRGWTGTDLVFFFFFSFLLGCWGAGFITASDPVTPTRAGRVLPSVVNPVNHGAWCGLAPRSTSLLTSPLASSLSLSASQRSTPAHKCATLPPPAPKPSLVSPPSR